MNNLTKLFKYESNGLTVTFNSEGGYIINAPTGIDTLTVSLSKSQGINQVGATIKSVSVQPRPITIDGWIWGNSQTAKDMLIKVFRPDTVGRLYAGDYYVDVYPTATPTIECRENFAAFQVSLLGAYPYWTSTTSKTYAISGVEKLFKFPWNISRSYQFGRKIAAAYINARNDGTVPVPFIVEFVASAAVTNPKLENIETGEFILLNRTLATDERVTITFSHERTTVVSSVGGDIRGAMTLTSALRRLQPGDNFLKPTATSGASYLKTAVTYSAEVAGIAL